MYKDKNKQREYQKKWHKNNRDKVLKTYKRYYEKNKLKKLEYSREYNKRPHVRERRRKYEKQYRRTHPQIIEKIYKNFNMNQKKRRLEIKTLVINRYGGSCYCCKEKILVLLTIDHLNNDGAKHRRLLRMGGGNVFYKWLIKNNFPSGFRVACWSCNSGAHLNGGICPHKSITAV